MRFMSSNMSSDSIIQGQIPIVCHLCDQSGSIKWKCLTCELLMCGKCRDNVHSRFKTAEPHEIVDIKNVGLPKKRRSFNLIARCEFHKGWKCCLYCTDCSVAVCPNCIAGRHKKHDMINFAEFVNDVENDSSSDDSMNRIDLSSDFEQPEDSKDLISPTFNTLDYVEKTANFWFMPDINKTEALLTLKATTPGTFLIRKSKTKVDCFALVLRTEYDPVYDNPTEISLEDCVSTYRIEKTTENKYQFTFTEQMFDTLGSLVFNHTEAQGILPCKLNIPTTDLRLGVNLSIESLQAIKQYWYFPDISRDEAIGKIKLKVVGSFLIRKSSSEEGGFVLVVNETKTDNLCNSNNNTVVRNFLIHSTDRGLTSIQGTETFDLEGLATRLVHGFIKNQVLLRIVL
ncbi:uncharacterized protein LOC143080709 isoform X2 [Mytilus galloprovincialis]|uniref:uncharacterized protein LOC143080709 isoform X2 n=1 Tax=Mytilus galloprovincialis TaxID=29158 RepID=UPI003F7BE564